MTAVIGFLKDWATLIGEVFAKYPLAAALLTAIAVGVFVILEKHRNKARETQRSVIHAFVTLLGWLIAVPVLGFLFDAAAKILEIAMAVVAAAYSALKFFYGKFEQQPIAVLILLGLAISVYLLWEWRFKPRRPWLRGAIAVAVFLALVALVVPVLNVVSPPGKAQQASGAAPVQAPAVAPSGTPVK